jgi:hypothetical protein
MPADLEAERGVLVKNRYEYEVRAQCPVNPTDTDVYQFTVESDSIIEVEKIVGFFAEHAGAREVFQETLTQHCAVTLGARVTSVGFHSNVKVTCVAP